MSRTLRAKRFLGEMATGGVVFGVALVGALLAIAIPLVLLGCFIAALTLPVLLLVRWVL